MLQVARKPRFPIVQWRLFETRHIIRDAGVKSALSRMGTVQSGLKTYCTSSRGLFVPCIKENRAVEVAIVQRNVGTSPGCDLLEDRRVHNCSLMSIASNRLHLTSEGKSPSNSGCCSRLRLSRNDWKITPAETFTESCMDRRRCSVVLSKYCNAGNQDIA
jgi:hypothetical protein